MKRKILQLGNKKLFEVSKEISTSDINSKGIKNLANDLIETTRADESAVGLSAVQIGVLKRMFVIKLDSLENEEYKILINPEIVEQSAKTSIFWEGCMSINSEKGKLYGPVERNEKTTIKYIDLSGNDQKIEATGFLSHLLLHELDHLNGKLFLTYIKNPDNIWNEENLNLYLEKHNQYPPVV